MLEFLIVGRSPLGSAMRAGILGAVFGLIGGFLFGGRFWGAIFAIAAIAIVLPIIYAISKRDNPVLPGPATEPAEPAVDPLDRTIPILPSRDFDETAAFYAKLGFAEAARFGSDYLILTRDWIELHFFPMSEIDPAASYAGCYLRATDVDTLHRAMSSAGLPDEGIPRLSPLEDKAWGMREFHLVDADGSLLRIGTPLPEQS